MCSRSGLIWFIAKTRVYSLLHPTGSSWMRMILISGASHLCHSRHPAGDAPAIGAEEGRKCLPAQSRQFGRHRHRYCGASSGTRRNHHRPVVYPVRDAMVVAYQARGAACSGDSYVSGIGALATDPGHRLYTVWCARTDGRGAPIVTTTDGKSEPIVWAVGAEGDDRLHGFRADTGKRYTRETDRGTA